MIKFAEASLFSGTALVICEHQAAGFALIGFAFVAALCRASIQFQKEKMANDVQTELIKTAANWIRDAFIKNNMLYGRSGNDHTSH